MSAMRRCAGYDKTTIIGMYVAIKIKNPPSLWYKQSDIYEIFQGNFFFARRNQYTNVGKTFLFLKLTHIKFDNSIVLINRHSIVIAAERSVIILVLDMGTCKDNWKGLNESAFPAHLYLS